ncbi:uncharacterized protein LJ206_007877 isoform 1-T1 [Theristicus caerulescens]
MGNKTLSALCSLWLLGNAVSREAGGAEGQASGGNHGLYRGGFCGNQHMRNILIQNMSVLPFTPPGFRGTRTGSSLQRAVTQCPCIALKCGTVSLVVQDGPG